MEILFVATSNYNDPFSKDWHTDIRYTVSFLRLHGIKVGFISQPILIDSNFLIESIIRMNPDNIFVYLTEENFHTIINFLKTFRRLCPRIRVIAGGIPATLSGKKLMMQHPEIDWIIAGERDLALLELLQRLQKGQSCINVQGLGSLEFYNEPRPLISNLDILGEMIHDGIDELLDSTAEEERVGYLLSSRGCYAHCSFCGIPGFYGSSGSSWRGRSVSAVVDELEHLSVTFGINYFVFEDDNFFGPGYAGQERAINIAHEILRRKLSLRFFFCCRLNDIHRDSICALKEAGLDRIGIGVESTYPESLRLFQKGLRVEQIYPTLELLDELKVKVEINMIFFDPHLSLEGVRTNLTLLEYLREKDLFFYSSSFPFNELKPFSWSPIAKQLKAEGLLNEFDDTCYYRDPKVSILAEWIRHLRNIIPSVFKRRLFHALETSDTLKNSFVSAQFIILTASVRHWIGLYLLPRYLSIACDLLDESPSDIQQQFEELERKFIQEITPLEKLFAINLTSPSNL